MNKFYFFIFLVGYCVLGASSIAFADLLYPSTNTNFSGLFTFGLLIFIIPNSLFYFYLNNLKEIKSNGLLIFSILAVFLSAYSFNYVEEETKKADGNLEIIGGIGKFTDNLYWAFLALSSIFVPAIDIVSLKLKLSREELIKLFGLSIGIHALLAFWLFFSAFVIGIYFLFTGWS